MPDEKRSGIRGRLAQGLRRLGRQGPRQDADETEPPADAEEPARMQLIEEIKAQVMDGDLEGAAARAAELKLDPDHALTGTACAGLVALSRGYDDLAHHELASLPVEVWSRYVAGFYVRAGLLTDREETLRQVRAVLAENPPWMRARQWLSMVEPVFGAGDLALARELMARADEEVATRGAKPRIARKHAWLHRWIDRSETSPSAPATRAIRFAVLDYDHPQWGKASANIGDHVQTIASLGHLVRHRGVSFDGPDDLRDLLERLQRRVRPELALDADPVTIQVITADRDATRYNAIPEETWTLAFGWYMHALFGTRFGFPFHPNLRPIFISFHCNKREMLSPDAITYLREHGPIGCRDWTTVDILLSLDVPAFFSGCMTTTINTVFEDLASPPASDAPVGYVDVRSDLPSDAVTYGHSSPEVRSRSFVEDVDVALQRLETYRSTHSSVVTSRLHCYLPLRSLGVPVEFVPENLSDIRFPGLAGISDDQFDAMRTAINDKLRQVFDRILAGAHTDEVYALWRELTAEDVRLAEQRHTSPAVLEDAPAELATTLAEAVAATRTVVPRGAAPGEVGRERVHVAVSVSEVDEPLRVALTSLCRRTDRAVHVWLLRRSRAPLDLGDLAAACGATLSDVPVRELAELLRDRCVVKGGRMWNEQLFLAQLLPDVYRAVVVPRDALVQGDVGRLADVDLGGLAFAAPDTVGSRTSSGFGVVHSAATRLRDRTDLSTELRRQAHGAHVFDFPAFDAGVMVLDLERLREQGFAERAVRLVTTFGLSTREAFHVVAGPHRARVPEQWYVVPTRQHHDAPLLLHWRDRVRPWTDGATPLEELWSDEADAAAAPVGR